MMMMNAVLDLRHTDRYTRPRTNIHVWSVSFLTYSNAQIKSLDYDVTSCYRKIFDVKLNENVRFCKYMFNFVDVDTLLA